MKLRARAPWRSLRFGTTEGSSGVADLRSFEFEWCMCDRLREYLMWAKDKLLDEDSPTFHDIPDVILHIRHRLQHSARTMSQGQRSCWRRALQTARVGVDS